MRAIILILFLMATIITPTTPQSKSDINLYYAKPTVRVEKKLDSFNQELKELNDEINNANL